MLFIFHLIAFCSVCFPTFSRVDCTLSRKRTINIHSQIPIICLSFPCTLSSVVVVLNSNTIQKLPVKQDTKLSHNHIYFCSNRCWTRIILTISYPLLRLFRVLLLLFGSLVMFLMINVTISIRNETWNSHMHKTREGNWKEREFKCEIIMIRLLPLLI